MSQDRKTRRAGLTATASLLALALVALPIVPNLDGVSLDGTAAYAKGGAGGGAGGGSGGGGSGGGGAGGGGSGGGGGPGGGSGGGGPGAGAGAPGDGPGNSGGHGQGPGSGTGSGPGSGASASAPGHGGTSPGQSGTAPGHGGTSPGQSGVAGLGMGQGVSANSHGVTAAALGNLNAAHAAAPALSNASLSSIVGQLGVLADQLSEDEDAINQTSLSEISNKTVDTAVVDAVNDLLGPKAEDVSRDD